MLLSFIIGLVKLLCGTAERFVVGSAAFFPLHCFIPHFQGERASVLALGLKLGISKSDFDAWYKIDKKSFCDVGGMRLLSKYGSSMWRLLSAVFPERKWLPFRFGRVPHDYWTSLDHQRDFLEFVAPQLNVKEGDLDGWYQVRSSELIDVGARGLLSLYNGSFSKLLTAAYPDHPWDDSKFTFKPHNYWNSLKNQQTFMEELGKKIGLQDLDGWYSVEKSTVIAMGGGSLLTLYKGSLSKLLAGVYPDHSWDPSKFATKRRNHWTSLDNQMKFMDEVGKGIGVKDLDGWYSVSVASMIHHGAGSLLTLYGNSLSKLLATVYPDHPWDVSKFAFKPQNFWPSLQNQKRFVDDLGKKIGIHSEADFEKWYEVSPRLFQEHGGKSLTERYRHSLPRLFAAVYPDYKWQPWRFQSARIRVPQNDEEREKLFAHLETSLGIQKPEDWYRVTAEQLLVLKVPFFANRPGVLRETLSKQYPNVSWDPNAFLGPRSRKPTSSARGSA